MNGNYPYASKDPMVKLAQELRIRNFSKKTIKAYLYYNKELLRFASYKSPKEITSQDLKNYLDFLFSGGKSSSTVNLAINALKFYYGGIMKRKFFVSDFAIKRPKKDKNLPTVLAREEIAKIISSTNNLKHKVAIQVLYSAGLRVSELADLKINDIDFNRKAVIIKGGKGKKDRITIISKVALDNISKYLEEYKPLIYLFESYQAGEKITVRTIQKIVAEAGRRAGITKNISAHSLRHSFATHLLEQGVNLRYIQELLGHARLETTQIYTKVAVNKFSEIKDLLEYA